MKVSGGLVARNWVLNLLGWVAPLLVALGAIPYVVHGLGAEQFGILSIASGLLGYFGIFDLGLGRATTKFVAESLALGESEKLPAIVWTSLWCQVVFGVIGTIVTVSLIPVIVDRFFNVAPALAAETKSALLILSASLCVVLGGNALRGVLEAGQLFSVVNYVKVPTNISMYLLPAAGIMFHLSLPHIVWLLVGARVGATVAYLAACLWFFPTLRQRYLPDRTWLPPLLVYGGWVTVSNFIAPLLSYVDRLLIGSLVSMSAVGYYSAPYEAINRAWVVPGTLAATLLPAFTNLDTGGSKRHLEELCSRSLKSLLLISAPTLLTLALFAKPVLRWWLGADFAVQGTSALQILALGMLINSAALVPAILLQGVGRPDLTGTFGLLEFVFQVGACWFLVKRFGIAGAAAAWTLRVLLDAVLMFGAVFWLNSVSFRNLLTNGMRRTLFAVFALALALVLLWQANGPFVIQVPVAISFVLVFVVGSWAYVLDSRDRDLLAGTANRLRLAFVRRR